MFLYAIAAAGCAWLLQSFLGYLQIKNFNKHYYALRRKGRVAIGRRKGLFRAGTVVLIAINRGDRVLEAMKMQGVTVFSRVQPMPGLKGKNIVKLTSNDLQPFDSLTAAAIQDAAANVRIAVKGGEFPQRRSLLEKAVEKFKIKKEVS
nr:transcriptional regulator GutM [Evansella caseinilytica]